MKETQVLWAATGWLTPRRDSILKKEFGNLEKAWKEISPSFLSKMLESKERIEKFFEIKKNTSLKRQEELLKKHKATLLYFEDEAYPENLKQISDYPIFLYCKGELKKNDKDSISVVGTRTPTKYGKQVCAELVPEISKKLTVVSGLALGVDGLAHKESLEAGRRTIGVIGTGVDQVYPSENRALYEKIENGNGAILSELPFGTKVEKFNFPRRNRIIAGLSLGTLVVEAKEKSGSLITANLAFDYGRQVFAIPGEIHLESTKGTNKLIKNQIAKLTSCSEDIFEELGFDAGKKSSQMEINFGDPIEEIIFEKLDRKGKSLEVLARESKLSLSEITGKITLLELKGLVKEMGGGVWVKV